MKNEPGMAYNIKKLNKVFAVVSIVFLLSVLWLFLDDFIRPWKAVQVKGLQIKRDKLSRDLEELKKQIDPKQEEQILADIANAEKSLEGQKGEVNALNSELAKLEGKIHAEKIVNGGFNAQLSEKNFIFSTSHSEEKRKEFSEKVNYFRARFAESQDRLKNLELEQKALKEKIAGIQSAKVEAEKRLNNLVGARDRLIIAKSKTEFETNPIWYLRNAPFLDFLDPTIKIQQVHLQNIVDDRYFQKVPKVDRCMTCHVFINEKGYEDQANPYKTHPNLDLMVGAASPHPMKAFGCTTCHGGEGHRVNDFNSPAHIPETAEQKQAWIEKYHWHEPHKVPQEMFKLSQTEASCLKCHQGVTRVPGAHTLNKGRDLIETYGCYACHKIKGFEHLDQPAPSLEKIASKVSKEFALNWVWDPFKFNSKSRMPSYFNQSNNSDPASVKRNITEVNTMIEWIWDKSKNYQSPVSYVKGDSARGKELLQEVGCLGCHSAAGVDEQFQKSNNRRGPHLEGLGSKIKNPDWLVSWILKPDHYQADTIMPSFRLTERDANDIATFLFEQKNTKFEMLKLEGMDKTIRDELLIEYFMAFDTQEVADAKLKKMSDKERTMELGFRSIGKYGCYSCHALEGFEGRAPIGPELSNIGSKPVTQFNFGHEKMDHKRDVWIHNHLEDPRRWDVGAILPFKDLSRMPNFNLNKDEIEAMTIYLIGNVSEFVPLAGKRNLSPDEAISERGFKVVQKYNCNGCHQIDGLYGEILKNYQDDINMGPPRLVGQGHRVQTEWFYNFLQNVHTIRPELKVKMPSFKLSNDELNLIVGYFQHKSKQPTFEEIKAKVVWEPGEKEAATALWNSFACTSCHTTGFNNEPATAPNLKMAKLRLRPSWIKKWLSDPQAIMPGTLMPNFWEGGESQEPNILGGDKDKQIQALVKLIQEFGNNEIEK